MSTIEKAWRDLLYKREAEIAALKSSLAEAETLLSTLYDKWENGIPCHEIGEEDDNERGASIGNAFKFSDEEEKAILTFLNPQTPIKGASIPNLPEGYVQPVNAQTSPQNYETPRVSVVFDSRDDIFVARDTCNAGCNAHGATVQEALRNMADTIEEWIADSKPPKAASTTNTMFRQKNEVWRGQTDETV